MMAVESGLITSYLQRVNGMQVKSFVVRDCLLKPNILKLLSMILLQRNMLVLLVCSF